MDDDKIISIWEFTLAPLDPMVRVLADMAVASSSKDADFWTPMLDLKCAVMRSSVAGFSHTRAVIEDLVDAGSESLSHVFASELMQVVRADKTQEEEARRFAQAIIDAYDVSELVQALRNPAYMLQLLMDLEDEIQGGALDFVRVGVVQRVLETLKLSVTVTATEGAELQVRKCIEDVLIDENVVRKLADRKSVV